MPQYDFPSTTADHTTFKHPEYQYWYRHWQMIRDCGIGEVEVKRKSEQYLPRLEGMEPHEYADYLDRAVFFNMTARTTTGLQGTLFQRNPVISGLPSKFNIANISKDNQTLMQFAKQSARELVSMGRYGILLDMDEAGKRPPYFAGYITENIVDWTVSEIEGRYIVTEVILRELRLDKAPIDSLSITPQGKQPIDPATGKPPRWKQGQKRPKFVSTSDTPVSRAARRWIASYRVLRLEFDEESNKHIYVQYFHTSLNGDASPETEPSSRTVPSWRGKPFEFIPFVFLGPYDNTPSVDKSPILDIVLLNLSHYKSYAQLEHGRFYTALPVYYTTVPQGQERGNYTVGPSIVWEVEKGEKPGIIEFNGSGLKYLENACNIKEDQIAALGGRLVGTERVSAGESNNKLKLKEANENSLLLNIANVLDVTFTSLLRWWAMWQDMPRAAAMKIVFETNKDFLASNTGAREFRAIQMMYEAGMLPIDVVYEYFRKAEVIPDWMALEEFKALLDDPNSFPNAADALARQRGAPSAETEWAAEHALLDPMVVAARGYDSQAPAGQQPLPGQTQGGPTTAALNTPGGLGAAPPAPVGGGKTTKVGPDGTKTTTEAAAPPPPVKPPLPPKGRAVTTSPRSTVKRVQTDASNNGTTVTDIGSGGIAGEPPVKS